MAPRNAALAVLFIREQTRMGEFELWCGHNYYFLNILFIDFIFYASKTPSKTSNLGGCPTITGSNKIILFFQFKGLIVFRIFEIFNCQTASDLEGIGVGT